MDSNKLGLWESKDLAVALSQLSGSEYYHQLGETAIFVHSVAKILTKRNAKDKEALCSAPSLYILSPVPEGINAIRKREPTFSLGGVEVSGKIWFGSAAMHSSNGIDIPNVADIDGLFDYISHALDSGKCPAIFFDGSVNETILRYYPNGVGTPDDCQDVSFSGANINAKYLKNILDKIHERTLITPTASIKARALWQDGSKCYPIERPEIVVQSIIELGLAIALGNIRVKREETSIFGRYDLALVEQDPIDPSKSINHAILELKAVKAFTSSGNQVTNYSNLRAISKGIKQAFAYRKEHGSRLSALCCYDMRPEPSLECPELLSRMASDLETHFWAWPLFSTTETARNWMTARYLTKDS